LLRPKSNAACVLAVTLRLVAVGDSLELDDDVPSEVIHASAS